MSFLRDNIANQLAGIATRGGEFGPYYDQGVLHVVNHLRATGHVGTSRFSVLSAEFHHPQILTPEERAEAAALLAELGLTRQQGAEFADGIRAAITTLEPYSH